MASESPKAAPPGGPTAPIRSSTSKGQKLCSWFRKPFSKRKKGKAAEPEPIAEPKPIGADIAQEQNPQAPSTTAPGTLLVTTQSIHIKQGTIDPAQKVKGLKLASRLIGFVQPVVDCTTFIFPTPVGQVLEQVTNVLEVLQQMVEVGTLRCIAFSSPASQSVK